jgi:hypothetical protein
MKRIFEWSFPVGLLLAWVVVASYTLAALAGMPRQNVPRSASSEHSATRT